MNATANTSSSTNSATSGWFRSLPWRWIIIGIVSYLIFLLATIPAARLVSKLQAKGVLAAGVSGTIWNGRAAALQTTGITLGATEWQISLWRLFIGQLSVDIQSKRDDGYINATVRAKLSGNIELSNVRASFPIDVLAALHLPYNWPSGWTGKIQANLDSVIIKNKWPTYINGKLDIEDLTKTQPQAIAYGTHRVVFPAKQTSPNASSDPLGSIESAPGGSLELTGSVLLTPNHTIKLDGFAKPTVNAPSVIIRGLKEIGIPDEQGRWPIGTEYASVFL